MELKASIGLRAYIASLSVLVPAGWLAAETAIARRARHISVSAVVTVMALSGGLAMATSSVTEYSLPTANAFPANIVVGPDGALWFTEMFGDKIGRITT